MSRPSESRTPCVLGVFPHPDDESYSAAAALAEAAEGGAQVVIVCATRGEAGQSTFEADRRADDPRAALASRRTAELADSCAAIGAEPPRFLSAPDAGLPEHRDDIRRELGAIVAELEPTVIVTLGRDGVYGHRDHLVCTELVSQIAGSAPSVARIVHAEFERNLFQPMCELFERRFARFLGPNVDCGALGIDPGDADLVFDASRFADRKRASIAAHRSQLLSAEPLEFLLPGLVETVCRTELFRVADGAPFPAHARSLLAGL